MSDLRLRLGRLLLQADRKLQQQQQTAGEIDKSSHRSAGNKNAMMRNKSWVILSCLDLLTMAVASNNTIDSHQEKLELNQSNLQAAKVAACNRHLWRPLSMRQSWSLMDKQQFWDQHYELALELFSFAAEMAYCCGKSEECLELYQEVKGQ